MSCYNLASKGASYNIAFGYQVVYSNRMGVYNTAYGDKPLYTTPVGQTMRGLTTKEYAEIYPYKYGKQFDLLESMQIPKINQGAEVLLIVAVFVLCFILIISARSRQLHQEEEEHA